MHNNLVKFSAALGLLAILALPALAFAQVQISTAIPGNNPNSTSSAPGAFVANFYQFALMIGGILAFGAIVYGGVRYVASAGNPSAQSDGKDWIWGALMGLLLLAGAYLVLNVINPQLVNLNLPPLNAIQAINNPVPTPSNNTTSPNSSTCKAPSTGPCIVTNLQNSCLSSHADLFAGICGNESGGAPSIKSGTDYCTTGPNGTGQKESISIGLFQINLTNSWKQPVDGKNCGSAFSAQAIHCSGKGPCTSSNGTQCQVTDMTLYNDCVAAAQVAAANISMTCQISNNGSNLGPWKADAAKCGF